VRGKLPSRELASGAGLAMFVSVLTFILVVCCWWIGDLAFRTKLLLTVMYLGSFALLWTKDYSYLFMVSQCALAAILGLATFGIDFLNRRVR
jgi:hypothetical protein